MATERIIGVDFGTSTSVIRVKRYQDGRPVGDPLEVKQITFGKGNSMVPTLVQKRDSGETVFFGCDAEIPHRGTKTLGNFKVDLESGDADVRSQARELTREFFAYLAKTYKTQSEGGHLGESSDQERTIISYPVKWSDETKAFMLETAKAAGFSNVEGLDEAQAAIQAVTVQNADMLTRKGYFQAGVPVNILLIDMGAGTTDLVLCRHTPGTSPKTEILCTWPQKGTALFGGHEVDDLLKGIICDAVGEKVAGKISKEIFKGWKENMVSPALQRHEVVNEFSQLDDRADAMDMEIEYSVSRASFEAAAVDYLRTFPELVNGCLEEAEVSGDEVELVILTGGHSQWYFVQEMLRGEMPQLGRIQLSKVQQEPERIIPIALPQETVALGLVYGKLAPIVDQSEDVSLRQGIVPAGTIDEDAHAVLHLFAYLFDREFREGNDWIEFPAILYGKNKLQLGQKCALYTDEGKIHSVLPIIKIENSNHQSVSVLDPEEMDEDDRRCRVRFAVEEKDCSEVYEEMNWILSAPVTERTYGEALFGFCKSVTTDPGDLKDENISKAFTVLVEEISYPETLKARICTGEIDENKELNLYKRNGSRFSLSWSRARSNLHYCTIEGIETRNIEVGDVISDYVLPLGYTFACSVDPTISWKGYVNVVAVDGVPKNGEKDPAPLSIQEKAHRAAIACSDWHTVGLRSNGTVLATGGNDYGECNVSDWDNIIAIAANAGITVGLKRDGTAVAMGRNEKACGFLNLKRKPCGQCDVDSWHDIIAIAAGCWHTVGLRSDGTMVATGDNEKGQCNVTRWKDIIDISAGFDYTVGLKRDGTVVATGNNRTGQCNVKKWKNISAIAAASYHTVGLKSDGTVVATGYTDDGRCYVDNWHEIIAVAAGNTHTVGLRSDGTVVATGYNNFGQCDVSGWHNIIAISADGYQTVGLRSDGTVVATGHNDKGQCNVESWKLF